MLKKLVLAFLFLSLFISFSTNSVSAKGNDKIATQEETKHFVKKFLKENFDIKFKERDISTIEPLYDVEDNLLAHHYKLVNAEGEEYFFVISVQKKYSPILVAGEGNIEDTKLSKNVSAKKYFMGGFNVISADSSDQLLNFIVENNPTLTKEQLIDQMIVEENIDADKQWEEDLVSPLENSISIAGVGITEDKLLTVPFFNQFDPNVPASYRGSACGPATQAAILEYWKSNRAKSGIKASTYYGSKGNFIEYMYNTSNGTYLGMSVANLGYGLVQHAYNTGGYSSTRSSFNNFATYMTEIKNFRPLAVKFDKKFVWSEPNRNYAYSYHWTVGAGYYYDSTTAKQTLKVHTNGTLYTDGSIGPSKVVLIDYPYNAPIITMIKFNIN